MSNPNPTPETFISCDCGAILGYRATVEGVIFFYLYAYPSAIVNSNLLTRRIAARVLSGDAWCHRCRSWIQLDLVRPWEKMHFPSEQ